MTGDKDVTLPRIGEVLAAIALQRRVAYPNLARLNAVLAQPLSEAALIQRLAADVPPGRLL